MFFQISYYQTTGFADVPPATEQYNGSYNTTAYQTYVRRDFGNEVQHCASGFYTTEAPLVITANTGSYSTIQTANGDYYGSYDVTSSTSSNSSASVYGDLSDQTHAK